MAVGVDAPLPRYTGGKCEEKVEGTSLEAPPASEPHLPADTALGVRYTPALSMMGEKDEMGGKVASPRGSAAAAAAAEAPPPAAPLVG